MREERGIAQLLVVPATHVCRDTYGGGACLDSAGEEHQLVVHVAHAEDLKTRDTLHTVAVVLPTTAAI